MATILIEILEIQPYMCQAAVCDDGEDDDMWRMARAR